MIEIINQARRHKQRTAIVSEGKSYSYDKLITEADKIYENLLDQKTDLQESRIAFLVEPGFEYVATQWAIWQAGGVAVPLCYAHPLESLKYYIDQSESSLLIISDKYEEYTRPLATMCRVLIITVEELLNSSSDDKPRPDVEKIRRAMILYTSGTTNLPKGVVTTHANIESQISTLVNAWEWSEDDVILNVLPLHHVHGIINVVSCALWVGACVKFLPKFSSEKVWETIEKRELTVLMAVPTIYFKLIKYWEACAHKRQLTMSAAAKKMRLMVSGSAALPVSVLEKWREISGHTLLERYGMTEIGMGLSNAYREERIPGHVGLPLPGVEIQLVDEDGKVVVDDHPGEIRIKGASVFKEYWKNPTATKEAFEDGWFKTGDIAIVNEGYYQILGRNSVDIIKSGGYKLSALEIEEALRAHPDITECAVVGLPDEEWGEIVCAGIVCRNSVIPNDLDAFLSAQLASYKLPRKYLLLEALPMNTMGKVTKKDVVKLFF